MKINLTTHSISKVIPPAGLLIFIVSLIHIFSLFNAYINNISYSENMLKLSELRINNIKLSYALRYQPSDVEMIVAEAEKQLQPSELLSPSWCNTQSLNRQQRELLAHWQQIKWLATEKKYSKMSRPVNHFLLLVERVIEKKQALNSKKVILVQFSELIEFLLIILTAIFLFYYAKKHISVPINKLITNTQAITKGDVAIEFPNYKNELGSLSQSIKIMCNTKNSSITNLQAQLINTSQDLQKANEIIKFLCTISQQLSTVKLSSPILSTALNELAKQANLQKVCLELNNGTFVHSALGCASHDPDRKRIPILINTKLYGFLNYVVTENKTTQAILIESFTGLVARALYQEEYCVQTKKILLMEEQGIIAGELHSSITQSLSFLKDQCVELQLQVNASQSPETNKTITTIESTVLDTHMQLRALLSSIRLAVSDSNFQDAIATMISELQEKSIALISIQQFEDHIEIGAKLRIHLLQIIRETIVNTIENTQSTTIAISCTFVNDKQARLTIIDNRVRSNVKNIFDRQYQSQLELIKKNAAECNVKLELNPLPIGSEVKLLFSYKKLELSK